MNLSPLWVSVLQKAGWYAAHWSEIGAMKSPDTVIMAYAKEHSYCVFTHDLDFSAILATTKAETPSVFQFRTQDVMPDAIGHLVINNMRKFQPELEAGAPVTVNETKGKVRVLPIR
ncbi:MAG: DUF5615 family PIN-like protein [Saprospiraceae bacterium]|nr:DUF5615 family PIN-like protein [Saprospiraceae bacterium]